jgi:type I restriction enzyme S subunit
MSKWREVRLGEVAKFKYGKSKIARERRSGKYDVYSSAGHCGYSDDILANQGIVIGRKGSIGTVYFSKTPFFCIDTAFYIDKVEKESDLKFMYYFLQILQLEQYNNDAAVPGLGRTAAHNIKIKIPDLETQEKIANVLSTYDELIENNNRRIELLEKTAEEIYKEWFVRMRFPGHENAKFKKGIPEGWEVKKVGDLANLLHGYTESTNEEPIGPKYLRGTDINKKSYINWWEVSYCEIEDKDVDKYRLYKNDIVIIRMADPGKVAIIESNIDSIFASYLIKIDYNKDKVRPYYMFYTLYSDGYFEHIKSLSSGTTRRSINSKMILSSKILVPDIKIQEKFNNNINIIRKMLNNLIIQNQNLTKQRDLLLPRLMNGTIELK